MSNLYQKVRNHFLPHKDNDFKPAFFSAKRVIVIIVIFIIAELVYISQTPLVVRNNSFLAAVLPEVLTILTNNSRVRNNLYPLAVNQLLVEAANKKAEDMANKGYFSHITPDGKAPWYWLDLVGYKYSYAGENLAVNFSESDQVLSAWMQSPLHKANIIKKEYTQIGIGTAQGIYQGQRVTFVVQFFASPTTTNDVGPR